MFIDTHAHFNDKAYDGDRHLVLSSLRDFGVDKVINIGADLESSKEVVSLANQYDFLYAAVGVHPYDASTVNDETLETLSSLSQNKKVVAIGEIGLDYHEEGFSKEIQKEAFIKQLRLAKSLSLPIVIHDRDSHRDVLDILKSENIQNHKCVMHCYSGSPEMLKEVLSLGMYISIGGVVTFKNAVKAVQSVKEVPLNRLMLETDCPYLAPTPHRGTRNSSSYIPLIAQKIAEIKGVTLSEIERETNQNAADFFGV